MKQLQGTFHSSTSKEYSISIRKVMLRYLLSNLRKLNLKCRSRILNTPDSINIKIFPDVVTVKCLVAVSDYKKINQIPLEVVIDLSKADLNSSDKIPVGFRNIPPFVSSLRAYPAKVDFLIEKKPR